MVEIEIVIASIIGIFIEKMLRNIYQAHKAHKRNKKAEKLQDGEEDIKKLDS